MSQGIIIAGDEIYAGIDEDDVTVLEKCVVVQFDTDEEMKQFMELTGWK